jgi:phospholipid/cholesterol/gamma-HCH transport system permease protein
MAEPAVADLPTPATAASLQADAHGGWALAGSWTRQGLAKLAGELPALPATPPEPGAPLVLDGAGLSGFDSAGAWLLRQWLGAQAARLELRGWAPDWQALMQLAVSADLKPTPPPPSPGPLRRLGLATLRGIDQALALLAFVGEVAQAAASVLAHPRRLRWRSVLHHVQIGGFDALPIVGLMSFLLGVVVAYQGADQLRHYGANIFVVELVGYSMLREFAPLMTAIIIAGRSGSSYAAQIGTMVVTEEVDAMRTLGMAPLEQLVLPRLLALAIALPLLTVWADITGVFGGMVMARTQLGIGFHEFIERFGHELQGASLLAGLGKSLVFAAVISVIGCHQGFRTRGSADSVGRQTTLAVVQSIFLVIVVDAVFSVLFNWLDI